MEIKEIKDRKIWDQFHEENPKHSFLQSWNWGDFNESMGHRVFRLGVFDGDSLTGTALVVKISARRGSFLLIPHGPIFATSDAANIGGAMKTLTDHLRSLAKREGCAFVRVNSIFPKNHENEKMFRGLGFRKAPIYVHAELLWLLDITQTESDLLKGMRKTTRYSINKAASDGVTVEKSENMADLKTFEEIYKMTVDRQHFVPYSNEYLKNEFSTFSSDKKISIFFAKYQGEIVSAAIIVYEKNEAFYHHGASSHLFPKITPTHLLQWEIIKDAKMRGCKFYNFWGIAPENKPKHPMAGLSLFKKGFGGFLEELLPTQDLILNPKYWLNFVVEKVRKLKRGL